jgi:hypothetical protein
VLIDPGEILFPSELVTGQRGDDVYRTEHVDIAVYFPWGVIKSWLKKVNSSPQN